MLIIIFRITTEKKTKKTYSKRNKNFKRHTKSKYLKQNQAVIKKKMNKDTGLIGNKYQNGRQKPYCIRDYINCKGINTLIKRQRLTKWKK